MLLLVSHIFFSLPLFLSHPIFLQEAKAKHEAARTQQWAAIEAAAQRQARKNPAAAAILAASLAGQSGGG